MSIATDTAPVYLGDQPNVLPETQVGAHLRRWRTRQGWSQLHVAVEFEVSARHLSFVETGRARPSRDLIVHLARSLRATNQEFNACLLAGGYAPQYLVELNVERPVIADTHDELLNQFDPYPAFVFDGDWVVGRMNPGGQWLCSVLMPELWTTMTDPGAGLDMVAALSHPGGLLSHMREPARAGWTVLRQLRNEQVTNPGLKQRADRFERSLHERYLDNDEREIGDRNDPSLHLEFDTVHGTLSFFTVQSVVGIPQQITVATPRVEMWYPADSHTRQVLECRGSKAAA